MAKESHPKSGGNGQQEGSGGRIGERKAAGGTGRVRRCRQPVLGEGEKQRPELGCQDAFSS